MLTGLGNVFLNSLGLQLAHVAFLISVRGQEFSYLMFVLKKKYDMYLPQLTKPVDFIERFPLLWFQSCRGTSPEKAVRNILIGYRGKHTCHHGRRFNQVLLVGLCFYLIL